MAYLESIKNIFYHNIQFIAWENFSWSVLTLWVYSLGLIFLFLWVCLFLGNFFTTKIHFASVNESLVINFAVGSSALSFLMALLAITHLFRLSAVLGILIVIIGSAAFLGKNFKNELWRPFHLLAQGFREEKILYVLFLVNSFPSILPPYRWDEMSYHLPYVMQWVEAGRITVDPSMRYPLNSFNFHMLQSIGMMLHSVPMTHLITWLTGCMSCLLIVHFLKRMDVRRPLAYVGALAFYLSPLTQRYLNVAMLDVPCMFYFAAAVFVVCLSRSDTRIKTPIYFVSALISAMFIGMRGANLFFIPLFLILAKLHGPWRQWASFSFICLGFGSIWYMRNLLIAGDPLPPVFHTLFHQPDPFWSTQDFQAIKWDMTHDVPRGLKAILSLPLRILNSTENGPLRDWPFQGFMLVFPFSLFLFRKKGTGEVLTAAWYAAVLWIIVSPLVRYAHFAVLAAVCSALALDAFFRSKSGFFRYKFLTLCLAVFIMIGPNLNALRYFKNNFNRPVPQDQASYQKFYDYLDLPAMQVIDELKRAGIQDTTVYTVGYTHLKYYYSQAGYRLIGDVVNRFRYRDFKEKTQQGLLFDFLKEAQAAAAVINKNELFSLDMTEKEILSAVHNEPRLKVVWNDQHSLILRTV